MHGQYFRQFNNFKGFKFQLAYLKKIVYKESTNARHSVHYCQEISKVSLVTYMLVSITNTILIALYRKCIKCKLVSKKPNDCSSWTPDFIGLLHINSIHIIKDMYMQLYMY